MNLRLAVALGLAAMFGVTQTGAWELLEHAGESACAAECPDDDDEGCPPGCEACVCCPTVRTAVGSDANAVVLEHWVELVVIAVTGEAPAGVTDRVFRPPRFGFSA